MINGSNPSLNEESFYPASVGQETMTFAGVFNKGMILFVLLMCTFIFTWNQTLIPLKAGGMPNTMPYMMGGGIGGFILAMITIFKKEWAAVTAPLYALCEGLLLGAVSAMFEVRMPGIAFNAISLTFAVLVSLFFLYRWGFVKATGTFKKVMLGAMSAIAIVYVVGFILSFFGMQIPLIHGSGPIGIAFSLVVVGIAAFSLILDFDLIETGVRNGAPKYMEWYSSFALLLTLIWLYLEILRLLSKLNSRD